MRIIKKTRRLINKRLMQYEYNCRNIKIHNHPVVFAIETTNFCNLKCPMCPRNEMSREVGYIEIPLLRNILSQIKDYNQFVWLHNFGEPLFHPKLEEIIALTSQSGLKPYLSTNATILTKEKSEMLLKSNIDKIIFSLDACNQNSYELIRAGGDFNSTKQNIIDFFDLKRKMGKKKPHSIVQIIKMKETEQEITVFKNEFAGLADEVRIKRFCTWAGQLDGINEMAKQEYLYYDKPRPERYPCRVFWESALILWNGDVVPCCMDYNGKLVLGNLNKQSLKEIWNAQVLKNVRSEHKNNSYGQDLCKNCKEWSGSAKKGIFF